MAQPSNFVNGVDNRYQRKWDQACTATYKVSILQHRNVIQGKVIVDVRCGIGILFIFCALVGAIKFMWLMQVT